MRTTKVNAITFIMTLPERGNIRRVWLVLVDHSVVGVWRTRREARAAVALRNHAGPGELPHFIVGPYVLQRGENLITAIETAKLRAQLAYLARRAKHYPILGVLLAQAGKVST